MKTSIIILTLNQLSYTKECIESIRKFTESSTYEIIVVDNNSNDGTVDWLREQQDIIAIYNQTNKGFPAGCNQGIRIAKGSDILLLNNDTIVTTNWLENLRAALYSGEQIGAVGCVTNNSSYYQQIDTSYQTLSDMHNFAAEFNISSQDKWEERLKLVGYCMLIKKDVVDMVGLLDERFTPGNYEDDDYSLRIRKAGYKLVLCKDTFIHHYGSVSFREQSDAYSELMLSNSNKFKEKWGFNPDYNQHIRFEIIDMIESGFKDCINILEVGCACGGTLLQIKNLYKNAVLYGIELNDQAAGVASLVSNVKSFDIENESLFDYEKGYFDYIIFADVLEHLKDPWKVLDHMKEYLKPDGHIIASIPNIMHYSVMSGLLQRGQWNYAKSGILDETHLRFFTYDSIQRMFMNAHYKEISITGKEIYNSKAEKFIGELSKFSNGAMLQQFTVYQYLVKAKNTDLYNKLKYINDNDCSTTDIFELFFGYEDQEMIDQILHSEEIDGCKVLNSIGVSFFENGKHERVIPFFLEAIELNPSDREVLYNLSYFLNYVGEDQLSADYLNRLRIVDTNLSEQLESIFS
ncbi:glycosyltransferase [Paenibacillus sp. PDC88]|uniref:glycosyltransferase n=1 Tax=Paenibacillus sp. PDC88 TaxID=1884375 RepID=UPI00089A9426|nr:glycosyltransferase [Paenibacillus sp. PDC88]SDW83618.1 Glycosyltransferase, GT2 family [Paenibacillus sp. PDC88]